MKQTAEYYLEQAYEVIRSKQSSAHEDVDPALLQAMKLYANAKLDEAASQSQEMIYDIDGDNPLKGAGLVLRNFQVTYATTKQAILKLKDEL